MREEQPGRDTDQDAQHTHVARLDAVPDDVPGQRGYDHLQTGERGGECERHRQQALVGPQEAEQPQQHRPLVQACVADLHPGRQKLSALRAALPGILVGLGGHLLLVPVLQLLFMLVRLVPAQPVGQVLAQLVLELGDLGDK